MTPPPRVKEDTAMADRSHTLRRFPVVATTSLDEARDAVTDVYLPHALRAPASLRMQLNAARQKRFTLGFLTYGAQAELRMPATETTYHVNLTTSGRTFAERGDGTRAVTEARRSGVVLLPDQVNTVRWTDDAEQLILKIPRTRLEAHLADLVGHPIDGPVDFEFGFSTASPRGRSLLSSVEFLARELDRDGGIAETPLAREQLEAFVMTQVLLAVRNSYTDLLEGYVARSRPTRLQAVLAYMETHAERPLTPGELARVGCMSVRALHAAFRDELGVSPMAHLRRIRLDRVHADLLRGAEPQRIGDVAMRWGFFHPSRFARQYKERFGELPSDTGRRA
jgi:AraC-like DNA-binding protein